MTRNDLELQVERDMDSRYGYYMVNGCSADDHGETEEGELVSCMECSSAYDPEDMPVITYKSHGNYMTICADCFFRMIGWEDAIRIPWGGNSRDAEDAIDYENALDIMRSIVGNTGHPLLDGHRREVIAMLERVVELLNAVDGVLYDFKHIGVGA